MGEKFIDRNPNLLVELTAEITVAYVRNHILPANEIRALISAINSALESKSAPIVPPAMEEKQKPAVSIRKSVQDGTIRCLECGSAFKSLKRHIMAHHGLSPEVYRAKWELPADYPMIAPAYARARAQLALELRLGHRKRKAW